MRSAIVVTEPQQCLELLLFVATQRYNRLEQQFKAAAIERKTDALDELGIHCRLHVVHDEDTVPAGHARIVDRILRSIAHRLRMARAGHERTDAHVEHIAAGGIARERLACDAIAQVQRIGFEQIGIALRVEYQETIADIACNGRACARVGD